MGMPMSCGRAVAVGGWVGGLVGGGEAAWGAWEATNLVAPNHRVRTERTAFCPTPGGSVELMQEDRPIYLGAGPLPRGCSRQFYPQRADFKAGRQGPTWLPGGWRAGLSAPAAAYRPLLHT